MHHLSLKTRVAGVRRRKGRASAGINITWTWFARCAKQ
jgi:hypothetical protein